MDSRPLTGKVAFVTGAGSPIGFGRLASDASNKVSGQRFIAYLWDDSQPLEQRLARASAPAAWLQAGQASIPPRT